MHLPVNLSIVVEIFKSLKDFFQDCGNDSFIKNTIFAVIRFCPAIQTNQSGLKYRTED